jgi:hypothetical protein
VLNNISSVVEFERWWVLKSKAFGQESAYSKEFFKKMFDELRFVKKCQNRSQFSMSKINQIFSKKKILLRPLSIKNLFFLNSIFEPLYFLNLHPIFDELTFLVGIFSNFFLGVTLILVQKSYCLRPTIFKIPLPN